MKKQFFAILVLLTLVSCSSEPMISDLDVRASENHNQLESLYQRINEDLAASKSSSAVAQNRQQYLAIVGRKIAEQKERDILNRLQRDLDKHTISVLGAELVQVNTIEQYNREVYLELSMQLQQTIDNKEKQIREKEFQFEQLSDNQAVDKVQLLEQISAIYGGEKAEQTQQRQIAYIDGLFEQANQAFTNKRYEDVKVFIANLSDIAPEDERLASLNYRLIAAEYEQKFWDALSKGKTDQAYATYTQLTKIPDYLEKNPDVVPIAEDMARYFVAEGNKQMGVYAISSAYQAYSRARFVQNSLGNNAQYTEGELKFVDYIARRLSGYIDKQQWVPAYSFASILTELNPAHAIIQESIVDINNALLQEAGLKVVALAFMDVERGSSLGARMVNDIEQALTADGQQRMQIIQEPVNKTQIAKKANAASYYFLSGEILDAVVSSKQTAIEETKTVEVSVKRIENPDYIAWTQLKKREKKNTQEPAATIEVPVEEQLTIQKTQLEKHALLTVAYRLTSVNGQVVFADAIKEEVRVADESIAGLQRGLFQQEEKQAELPDNTSLLDDLSKTIAQQAASKIAAQADTLEGNLLKQAEQAVVTENFNRAVAYYAYSDVLAHAQQQQSKSVVEKLRSYAIRWKD